MVEHPQKAIHDLGYWFEGKQQLYCGDLRVKHHTKRTEEWVLSAHCDS